MCVYIYIYIYIYPNFGRPRAAQAALVYALPTGEKSSKIVVFSCLLLEY